MKTLYVVLSRDRPDFLYTTYDEQDAEQNRKAQEELEEHSGGRPSVYVRITGMPTAAQKLEVRITGRTKEQFQSNLERFLNVATFISLSGSIPTQREIDNASTTGRWWYRDGDRFQLLGIANNDWLNIRAEEELQMDVEFNYRYDIQSRKKKAITALMLAFFDFVLIIP
jgi:hypothetical protein